MKEKSKRRIEGCPVLFMPSLFPAVVFLLVHDQVQFYADILIAKECDGATRGV